MKQLLTLFLALPSLLYLLSFVLAASTKVLGRCEPAQNSTLDLFLYHFDRLFGADLLASGKLKYHHQQPVVFFFSLLGGCGRGFQIAPLFSLSMNEHDLLLEQPWCFIFT